MDDDGYIYIMGRVDDVINVAGHRLSTGGMEEVVSKHQDVAECAVIGVNDALKGQVPIGFIVLKAGVSKPNNEITKEVVTMVRGEIGALACLKDVVVVPRLPKTRSGKILRATMRKIADGEEYKVPSTIDDPASLQDIQTATKIIVRVRDYLTENPIHLGKALTGMFKGFYRYRYGDYRVIYAVSRQEVIIIIARVSFRRDVYRR
jgi:propionyl-CoA synthetase